MRCGCQVDLVLLRNTVKNFSKRNHFLPFAHQSPSFLLALWSLAWPRLWETHHGNLWDFIPLDMQASVSTGLCTAVVLAVCCNVCYQTTEDSASSLLQWCAGYGHTVVWNSMWLELASQYVVSLVKEHLWLKSSFEVATTVCKGPNATAAIQGVYAFFILFSWISLVDRIFAQTTSCGCFTLSSFHYLTVTKRRSHNHYSIKSRP